MAKGWLGRARGQSHEQGFDAIGQPILMFSDAEPRQDLQSLSRGTPNVYPGRRMPQEKAFNVLERPRTASASSGSDFHGYSRPRLQPTQSYNVNMQKQSSFLEIQTPLADEAMIGMALGSPTHPPQRMAMQDLSPSPLATNLINQSDEINDHTKVKGGKWKKLGDLFRVKTALSNHEPSSPFYSLQPEQNQRSSRDDATSSPDDVVATQPWTVGYGVPKKAQNVIGGPASRVDKAPSEETTSVSSSGHKRRARSRSFNRNMCSSTTTSRKRENTPEPDQSTSKGITTFQDSPMFLTGLPSLDIEIPDAQMERYSIMFSAVLGKSNSPSLLARRSRMLEKLRTISDEADQTVTEPVPELPKNLKEQPQLAPQPQARRATSPAAGKSPTFSLFPHNGPETIHQTEADMTESTGQKSASPHRPQWSSDRSYLSPASTVSSAQQEDDIIFDVKALSYLNENNEPQWEMISTDKVNELNTGMRKNRRPDYKPSPLADSQVSLEGVDRPGRRRANTNQDALAALEAPIPKGQDIKPLAASKAAVDRVMSPPPKPTSFSQQAKVSEDARALHVPKLKVRDRSGSLQRPSATTTAGLPIPPSKPTMQRLVTAVGNDLDDLEEQIESRAVRAMKKQARQARTAQMLSSQPASTAPTSALPASPKPKSAIPASPAPQSNMPTSTIPSSTNTTKSEPIKRQKANSTSVETIASPQNPQQERPALTRLRSVRLESPLDTVRALSPARHGSSENSSSKPSSQITSPNSEVAEVQIARSISMSKRQRQMLVPIGAGMRNEGKEDNIVERTAQGPLTPQIVDIDSPQSPSATGKGRGHRYEKSQDVVVERA